MSFQNKQIDLIDISTIEEIIYEKLDPAYRKVSIYITAIISGILLLIYLAIGFFKEELFSFPIILTVMIFWSILTSVAIILAFKSYEYEGYALRTKDILYKSGMFFRSTIIIPFNRVQHCEIEQGPVDRMFDLVEISLFTAGGSSSDLSIPGLTQEKATALKNFITSQVANDEEE